MTTSTRQRADTIDIQVNGDAREIPAGRTIAELLADLELHPRLVVVEHNREILERERYAATGLEAGDVVELVHFVGGG